MTQCVIKTAERLGGLRYFQNGLIMGILRAGVAKLVYAPDSKSGVRQGHVGSSPTSGTTFHLLVKTKHRAFVLLHALANFVDVYLFDRNAGQSRVGVTGC